MKVKNGISSLQRPHILSAIKKPKKTKIIFKQNSMYDKIHEHFSQYDLLKLKIFGEDIEKYGNLTLKGISYPPKKIKLNYITNSVHLEEDNKNNKKIFNFEDNDNDADDSKFEFLNLSNRKININKDYLSKIHLPLLKVNKNKNKSMENISDNKFNKFNFINNKRNKINKNIILNQSSDNNFKQNTYNISIIQNNIRKNEHKNILKNIKIKKETLLPLYNNNINVTSRNIKRFLQTNKSDIKTTNNRKNHILNRNCFLKRYDNTAELNNRLNELKNDITKVNMHISKVIDKNDEDITQFKLRFKYIFSKFKN